MNKTARIKIFIFALVMLALYTNINSITELLKLYRDFNGVDSVSYNIYRYDELKKDLKQDKSAGYISYKSGKELFDDLYLSKEFIITQYVLVPVYLYNTVSCGKVVGDFPIKPPSAKQLKKSDLILIKDYGKGIYLYKNSKIKHNGCNAEEALRNNFVL